MNGTWNAVEIAGKQADAYDPPAPPRFALIYLHAGDLATLRGRLAFTRPFDELRLACVCPRAGWSWWADRICPEFDSTLTPERYVLDHVLPFCRDRWGLAPPAVGLLGVSMGGQGALRLAFKHPQLFPAVAAISSSVDYHEWYGHGTTLDQMYDSKEQCRQDTAPMHVHPSEYPAHVFFSVDPDDERWFRGNDRLHEKLAALGVPHQADLATRAGGHAWTYFEHQADRAVRFLHAALVEQSRRLL